MSQCIHHRLNPKNFDGDGLQLTLFSKKTAYADLVVSCPSEKRGNSVTVLRLLPRFEPVPFAPPLKYGSDAGALSCI